MIITAREEHDGTFDKNAVYVSAIAKTISEGEDHQASELVFSDNSGGVLSDIDVSTDGKVKFTQAVSDIDEVMKLKVTSSDVNEAAGVGILTRRFKHEKSC